MKTPPKRLIYVTHTYTNLLWGPWKGGSGDFYGVEVDTRIIGILKNLKATQNKSLVFRLIDFKK